VQYCANALDAAQGADALVVLTEWNEFRALAPAKLKAAMRGDVLVDLRNVYDPEAMRAAGLACERGQMLLASARAALQAHPGAGEHPCPLGLEAEFIAAAEAL